MGETGLTFMGGASPNRFMLIWCLIKAPQQKTIRTGAAGGSCPSLPVAQEHPGQDREDNTLSLIEECAQSIPHSPPGEIPPAQEHFILGPIFRDNKERLLGELRGRLETYLPSDYYDMILFDPKGRQRTERYFDTFLMALDGDLASFIKDQELIGYKRAIQGYPLEGVIGFTITFKSVIWNFIRQHNLQAKSQEQTISMDEVFYLHSVLDHSYYSLSRSFILTRDEIIDKRRRQLHDLHLFAGQVVSIFKEEMLWEPVVKGVESLFSLKAQLVMEALEPAAMLEPLVPKNTGSPLERGFIPKLVALVRESNQVTAVTPTKEFQAFGDQASQQNFVAICLPLPSHSRRGKVFLLLHDQGQPFTFERFDKNLLSQFVYFTGSVLVNCSMVSELAEKREYLSNLTSTLFNIQESERKRIAADIHDVITQALSGIGFKLILCQELVEKQPQRLEEELNRLVDNVNEALHYSRHIVSNLRPTILDNLGIVAALKKIANDFMEHTGVDVEFSSPPHIVLPPDADISIFRILQEALHNIRKHARATQVQVKLKMWPGGKLEMVIEDNGKGFDHRQPTRGLGMMLMRERAENLGGRLQHKSSPGNGTTVRVVLPLAGDGANESN